MKTRILLIEDDPALRKLLKEALPESIFLIDTAETGREGLDIIVKRNLTTYSVDVEKRPLTLTAKEFDLLYALMKNAGRILTREFLLERIWGYAVDVSTRTVDVHIRRLRKKLGLKSASLIETFRGVGYKFKEDNHIRRS